jgi:glycosyltransferase 2 family protein
MPGSLSGKQIIKITISVVMLAFLLHYTGFESTLHRLSEANLWYVPVGVGLYLIAQLVSAYRWKFLSEPLGFRLSFREFYDYYLIGMFFNLFLPGAIGGDMLRMVYLAKSAQRKKREALLTLLAERGVGLVAMLILTSLVCLTPQLMAMNLQIPLKFLSFGPVYFDLRLLLLSLSSAMLLGYLALWCAPLERLAERIPKLELLGQAKVYWANIGLLCKSVAVSLVTHSLMVVIHLLVAAALNVHVDLLYITVVYGIVSLASVLPIAFNGFGVREGTYLLLLTKIGIPPETAMAFAFYWVIISTCTSLMGGVVLIKGHYKTPSPAEIEVLDPDLPAPQLDASSQPEEPARQNLI